MDSSNLIIPKLNFDVTSQEEISNQHRLKSSVQGQRKKQIIETAQDVDGDSEIFGFNN